VDFYFSDFGVIRPSGLFRSACHSGPVSGTCAADILGGAFRSPREGRCLGQGQKLLVKFSVAVELTTDPNVHFGERAADPASS
jgi:hypothetical protein